jgi:hypothetical protein
MNQVTELAQKCFPDKELTVEFAAQLEKFAVGVANMEREKLEAGYNMLSFLHTETMEELVTQKKMNRILSKSWVRMAVYDIKCRLGLIKWWD